MNDSCNQQPDTTKTNITPKLPTLFIKHGLTLYSLAVLAYSQYYLNLFGTRKKKKEKLKFWPSTMYLSKSLWQQ